MNQVEDSSNSWGWIVAGVSTVITTLSSAVAFLFRGQVKLYETRIGQLEGQVVKLGDASDKCQEEHSNTKVALAKLEGRLEAIEKK